MTYYPEHKHPTACIFGTLLKGTRNKANPQKKWVRIRGFFCEIVSCTPSCVSIAKRDYGSLELYWNIGDSLGGKRGIIEPAHAYSGPGLITQKKPVKTKRHHVSFTASANPAVCFYDTFESGEKRIGLRKIQLVKN